jgi:4-diphosphocytidyl-2-C-methyl-D-erythritol kinase
MIGSRIVARTPAKVNLHLEVLHQRDDGYHEIETVFQTIDLRDEVTVEVGTVTGPIHVQCDHPGVPLDRSNLCHRAAKLLRTRTGIDRSVTILLKKEIPVAAGLGGRSSDAAATLLALDRLWKLDLDHSELHALATKLGADVPFFLRGGTAVGRGIGDQLTPVNSSGMGVFLLITLPMEISTQWVYDQLRMGLTHNTPKVNVQTIRALLSRFPERPWPGTNRLADVVLPAFPQLQRLLHELLETRPALAMLSGSGPTVFAVYDTEVEAERAREAVVARNAFTWIGRSTREGVVLREGCP